MVLVPPSLPPSGKATWSHVTQRPRNKFPAPVTQYVYIPGLVLKDHQKRGREWMCRGVIAAGHGTSRETRRLRAHGGHVNHKVTLVQPQQCLRRGEILRSEYKREKGGAPNYVTHGPLKLLMAMASIY